MKQLTIENFEQTVKEGVVLVDFWAPWCGPCRMQGAILEEMDEEGCKAEICKVNVDDETALAQAFGVMSIPTLVLFKDGKQVAKMVGLRSREDLEELLENL